MSLNNRIGDCREILEKLVAFEIFGGDPNIPIATYIKSILSNHGVLFHTVSDDIGNKEAIIARIGPEEDGGLILSGHTDVVPVKGQNWTMPQFILTEKDGKLYSRGSVDMKGFLACCLSSIQKMKSSQLKKPIYFAFSYDEEIGCLSGDLTAQAFAKYFNEKPKYAIIGEPSMMQPVIGQKGICVLETIVNGSAGHSSRIKSEVSAINVAARLIVWLEKRMDYFIEQGILYPDFTPPHTSLHVGKVNGGIAPNVIADHCSFFWDTRNIPGHDINQVIQEFRDYCDGVEKEIQHKFAGFKIITRIDHPAVPPLGTKKDASIVPFIQKITGNYTSTTVAYAAEAGQFSNAGFETVICGPGDIAQAHRADEFVEIDQLSKCLDMIDKLVEVFSI